MGYQVARRHTATVVAVCAIAVLLGLSPAAISETSKLTKEGVLDSDKLAVEGKNKLCCGYPLSEDLGFALRFYWLAMEESYSDQFDEAHEDIYTKNGWFIGSYPADFVKSLNMEGSGLLADGRVINYDGRCKFGVGKCFDELDRNTHPYGRGAKSRPLVPFKSVAVDPRLIPIGEPLYIPEFDGLYMPDGSIHDGCVRADDTGGGIKQRKIDFFVVSYQNFRDLLTELWGVDWITPHIEAPRCQYLLDE